MNPELHINIDHVATIRNARMGLEPDLIDAIKEIEKTHASGITTHLREDRRHIKDADIKEIDAYLKNSRLGFTFEMGATEEIRAICLTTSAKLATIVPEKREELTTEGGLDVLAQKDFLAEFIKPIQANGTKISMFVDPEKNQIQASKDIDAEYIEIHTGTYANHFVRNDAALQQEINRIKEATSFAQNIGLNVNLGHGLTSDNLPVLLEHLANIHELHIGHSIIANAVLNGMEKTIAEFS